MIEFFLVLTAVVVGGVLLAGLFLKLLAGLIVLPIHLGVGLIKVIIGLLLAIPAIILVAVLGTVMLPLLLVLAIPLALAVLVGGLFA